jgi:hypothetical protein
MDTETDRDLLRHALATLAYRAGKTFRDPPDGFASFRAGPTTRTPVEIVGHLADLMEWGLSIAAGQQRWSETLSEDWGGQVTRFYGALSGFDSFLESDREFAESPRGLLQGPIADALTHVGQIAMLRRLAGGAVRGENYFKADIRAGHVGPDQTKPTYEFD